MVERWAKAVIRHRRWVVAFIIISSIFFLYQARKVRIYYQRADLTPNNHSFMKLQYKMEEVFGGNNLIVIGIRVKEGDIFNPTTLGKIYRIADKLYFMRGVVKYRIFHIASLKLHKTWNTIDEYGATFYHSEPYQRIVERILRLRDENPEEMARELEDYKKVVLASDLVKKGLVSKDNKGTVIYADFWWEEDYQYIFKNVKAILEAEKDDNHEFYFAGRPIELGYMHSHLPQMLYLFGLAVAVTFILLFICFRTLRGIWIPMLGSFVAVAWLVGLLGLFRVRLDVLSLTVPFIIFAIATSHSVQIVKRYYEEFAKYGEKLKAAEKTLEALIEPAITAVLTDGAGFASLAIFDIRILRSLGTVTGLGIISVFLVVTLFIHALIAMLPAPKPESVLKATKVTLIDKLLKKFAYISVGKNRWAVFAAALLVLTVGFVGMNKVTVGFLQEGSPNLWADSKYNQDEKFLNEHFLGVNTYYIYVAGKEDWDLVYKPEINSLVDKLQRHLEKMPQVGATLSYADDLKRLRYGLYDEYSIPETPMETHRCFDRWTDSVEPEGTRSLFELDYRQANIQVFLKDHKTATINAVIKETEEFVKNHNNTGSEIKPAAGLIGIFASIIDEIERKTLLDTFGITIVIMITCAFGFRSLLGGLAILLPLGVGKVMTYGIMGFVKEGLFLGTVTVMAPGMGVGVDYAIYTLSRLREEVRQTPDEREAYAKALTTSGKAVFYTAMSVILGVSVLAFSELRLQALMGGFLAIVLILNMLASLLVMPALISIWKPRFIYGR